VQTVHLRHRHVHHDHVGVEFLREREALETIPCLADHRDAAIVLENAPESLSHQRMIVDQHHANRLLCGVLSQ
jgi:hypothetical protein